MHYVKICISTNKIALFTNKMMKRSTRWKDCILNLSIIFCLKKIVRQFVIICIILPNDRQSK